MDEPLEVDESEGGIHAVKYQHHTIGWVAHLSAGGWVAIPFGPETPKVFPLRRDALDALVGQHD
jgi:hypothetical protein